MIVMTSTLNQLKSTNRNGDTPVRRILVMDSDANLRHIYKQALGRAGYEVYLAMTPYEARVLLAVYHFDVFISDTHLNGYDRGLDLLREQAPLLTKNGTRIIMVSCDSHYQDVCKQIGADIFIEKPVSIDRLITMVERLVQPQ